MEVKSAIGVIVVAPTAGACAALPGAVIAMAEEMGLGEEEMAKPLAASGLIDVFVATRWTFAAEVGGMIFPFCDGWATIKPGIQSTVSNSLQILAHIGYKGKQNTP